MRALSIFGLALLASVCSAQVGPWPVERHDRWGTGCATVGSDPSAITTPWISNVLALNHPVSHGPSIGPDGIGYFGDWVGNNIYKFDSTNGAVLGSFLTNRFCESVPALVNDDLIVCGTDNGIYAVDTQIMDFNWFLQNTGYI